MTTRLADIAGQQQAEGPVYFEDPAADRALRLLLESLEEICVLRDRLDTVGRLLARGEQPTPEAVDAFEVSESLAGERLAGHRKLFEATFERLRGD